LRRGQYDRAIELRLRATEASPDNAIAHWNLFQAYPLKGMYAESVRELGMSMKLVELPETATRLDRAFATSGWRGALLQWAREFEQLIATKRAYFPGVVAQAYAQLGDKDRAFYWLEQGLAHRHLAIADPVLVGVKTDPWFAPLRSDARFNDFLHRMGLLP
jgi:tetratricopeptide (TPR) repeat protein